MRTTLTLEPDVAALVKRAMREKKASLKIVINDAIRAGLSQPGATAERETPYRIPTFKGKLLVPIERTWEVLAWAEGEAFPTKPPR